MVKKEFKQQLHYKALAVAQKYKRCELELIDILEQVDKYKICYSFGYSSLYNYASDYLGPSKDVAAIFINVARKTRELPALREEIKKGHITVSKARRMTSVINNQNQDHWLKLAKSCSKAQLEKEVARVQPKQAVLTRTKYVAAELEIKEKAVIKTLEQEVRIQLQVGVSEELMLKLRRVQDILSQKRRKPVDLEGALEVITEIYLPKEDPVKKAQRQKMRGQLNDTKAKKSVPGHNANQQSRLDVKEKSKKQKTVRKPFTAQEKHQVYLKYRGKCGYKDSDDRSCNQSMFLEIHHKKPVSKGGTNNLSNLLLLCNGHHKVMHKSE